METDPYRSDLPPAQSAATPVRDDRASGAGRIFAFVAVVALAAVAAAWAAGLFTVETDGALKAPEVSVEGGEIPEVQVNTADVDVGTRTETVEVPTVTVTKPEDANR